MSYEADLWDSFETVSAHARDGKKFCLAYSKFIDELSKLNKEYAAKLQKLCKAPEEDSGTLNTAWGSLKLELENMAQAFLLMSEDMLFKAKSPVEMHVKETAKSRKKTTDAGKKLIDSYTTAVKEVYASKDAYEKAMKQQELTQGEYDQLSTHNELVNTNKVTKKLAADKKKSESADKRYRKAVEKVTALEMKMYDTEMPHLLGQVEALERQRIEVMKGSIGALSSSIRTLSPAINGVCDSIDSNVGLISADADIAQFCAAKNTGKTKDSRTVYEPFSSELQRCVRPGGDPSPTPAREPTKAPSKGPAAAAAVTTAAASAAPLSVSRSMTASEVQRSQPQLSAQQSMPSMAVAPASGGIGQCRGLHDYTALNNTELSFKKGDVITILSKDPSGWWKGELNGHQGFFPSVEWVEEMPMAAAAQAYQPPPQQQQQPQYHPQPQYQQQQPQYQPQQQQPYQQQHVPVDSQPGLMQSSGPAPTSMPVIGRCQALYDMEAQNPNELTLTAGEILTISTEVDGWYFGENSKGEAGMYPKNYTQLL